MKNNNIIMVILLLVVAVVSFYGGTLYQSKNYPNSFANRGMMDNSGPRGQNGIAFRNRNGSQGMVRGQIENMDDKSLTIKMPDGSSKLVLLTSSTTIDKVDQTTKADLKTGQTVAVFGAANSDGSISATSIQLNPQTLGRGINPSGAYPTK